MVFFMNGRHVQPRAMEGDVDFKDALAMRLDLLKPSVSDIERYQQLHPPKLTAGAHLFIHIQPTLVGLCIKQVWPASRPATVC